GAGVACFAAQADTGPQPLAFDLIGFGMSLAVACAVAAAVTLFVGGEKGWAAAVVLAVSLASLVAAALGVVLWMNPSILRNHTDAWSFLPLLDLPRLWSAEILRFQTPFAAGVGLVIGMAGGLLILLSRRMPRLAIALAYGLLFACAAGPVQRSGLDIVI